MNRLCTFILLWFLFLFCSCVSPPSQIIQPDSPSDFTFDVTIVNNTLFDVEIMDSSRIIPRQGEKTVTLPSFFGELNEGYSLIYRVPLLSGLFLRIPRQENLIIRNDQRTALVDSPDFQSDLCFLVLLNTGNQTISLKEDNGYLNSVAGFEPKEYSSSIYLGPGDTSLYELRPGQNNLSIETDQYRTVSFPLNVAVPGFIYTFIFDGNEAFHIDARPLVDIEKNAKVVVGFEEVPLSQRDKQVMIDGLKSAFQTWNTPLEPDEDSIFGYLLTITIDITHFPPTPPVNANIFQAGVKLAFSINGRFLCESYFFRVNEFSESLLFLRIADQLKQEKDFFLKINDTIKL